tara:strand:- start:2984 stop:3217 length:234 start_codon:yes stop_codon:yes gene_type:complete
MSEPRDSDLFPVLSQFGWTETKPYGNCSYVITNPKDWREGCKGKVVGGFESAFNGRTNEVMGMSILPFYTIFVEIQF